MRILFLGDVVGSPGREFLCSCLPSLIAELKTDFVVVNGENASGGRGISEQVHGMLSESGVDVITGGNHSWSCRESLVFIGRVENLLRPLNFPAGSPGSGAAVFVTREGARVMVINLIGRMFMNPLVDDPFSAVERALEGISPGTADLDAVIVDFHAEATSEKQAMACFLDGRATLVAGTHTHVPTADHRVMAGGTATVTDLGMCGCYDSVIGMDSGEPVQRFTTGRSSGRFEVAQGEVTLSGVIVDTDDSTGLAAEIFPFRRGGCLEQTSSPRLRVSDGVC